MPYAVLEKEIERLDEAQQNAVVLFVRFLLSRQSCKGPSKHQSKKIPLFGALKDKIKFIASDFDEPLEVFAEYM